MHVELNVDTHCMKIENPRYRQFTLFYAPNGFIHSVALRKRHMFSDKATWIPKRLALMCNIYRQNYYHRKFITLNFIVKFHANCVFLNKWCFRSVTVEFIFGYFTWYWFTSQPFWILEINNDSRFFTVRLNLKLLKILTRWSIFKVRWTLSGKKFWKIGIIKSFF